MIERLSDAIGRNVSRETFAKIELYVDLLRAEARRQNLVSPSTLETVWERHILDSAQLVRFEPRSGARWCDVGSGAGLPGIVVSVIVDGPVTLIEPRKLRADFLRTVVQELGLASRVAVHCDKVERVQGAFDVITGRAVAALDQFLGMSHHLSSEETVWALPKGRNAQTELAQARLNWHCDVSVEQSCTDPESQILVLTRVGKKKR